MNNTSFALARATCRICAPSVLAATALIAGSGPASAASLFENYLERGYSEVAVYALTKARDNDAGLHFARKAADAANGEVVIPDSPADTGRPVAQLVELYDSHTKLMEALNFGAADRNARLAAVAQVNFDCWLAQLEVNPPSPNSSSCRLLFYTALERITADPGIGDLVTSAGQAATGMREDDHAAGGNDNPDGLLLATVASPPADDAAPMSPAQSYAGPISALSSAAPGDYATAAWIYPPPMTPLPATSGARSEGTAGAGLIDPDAMAGENGTLGGAVGNTSGALGGAVGSAGGALGGTVSDVSKTAGGALSAAGGAIGGPVGGVADAAGEAVSGTGGALGGTVGGVADAAGGAVSGLGGALGGALGGRPRAN